MGKNHKGYREKPRMCDPGMCDHCEYVGEGDFICDMFPDEEGHPAILVVEDWMPTSKYKFCKRGGSQE